MNWVIDFKMLGIFICSVFNIDKNVNKKSLYNIELYQKRNHSQNFVAI